MQYNSLLTIPFFINSFLNFSSMSSSDILVNVLLSLFETGAILLFCPSTGCFWRNINHNLKSLAHKFLSTSCYTLALELFEIFVKLTISTVGLRPPRHLKLPLPKTLLLILLSAMVLLRIKLNEEICG